jgi:hypothetical protein
MGRKGREGKGGRQVTSRASAGWIRLIAKKMCSLVLIYLREKESEVMIAD